MLDEDGLVKRVMHVVIAVTALPPSNHFFTGVGLSSTFKRQASDWGSISAVE